MHTLKISFIFLLIFSSILFSQNIKLFGAKIEGGLIVGKGTNLKSLYLDKTKLVFDKGGNFIFGFGRNDSKTHWIKAKFASGKTKRYKIVPKKRKYNIQVINDKKEQFFEPPKEELPRIAREKETVRKAKLKIGKDLHPYFLTGFVRPVKGGRITGVYGSIRILNGIKKSPHFGLDIAEAAGNTVRAAAAGIVRLVGKAFYYNGNFVLIDHGQGLSSYYLHMSKTTVKTGDFVRRGEKIGEVGSTGRATGPHLHWEVRWNNVRIDPALVLKIKGIR